jgi:hypothetical protein
MPASTTSIIPVAPTPTTYNPVVIENLVGATTNDYSVRVETGNSPGGIYNATRTINRTWFITPATNIVSTTVNLYFQYAGADANASCLPAANMELGHFIPGAPGSWSIDPAGSVLPVFSGGVYNVGPYAPNTLGSSFVLGNVGAILAFEKAISLNAQKQNNKTHLSWTISNTTDIKQTVLERSNDAKNFTALALLNAGVNYFDDEKLLAGINYYRIKITNQNGKVSYSPIVAVLNKESGFEIVNLMPNIITSNAILNVTAAQKTKMTVVITDITGRQVQKVKYDLIAGSNQCTLDFTRINAGSYLVTGYTADGVSSTIRCIKE